ncbi:predicted protein [Naegleria gruberi]|uniref:Predicted protein n=1 Tax=Naegleria gruberi TaxID=5762 RepID=D2VDL5_NAEGR|nr:uncharacterized protein NAEGRDRAFT_66963 [Naegleria gruberi]EFC45021.1 predicted protein [Naegleria gruberi]|eukprot:XP_002677765.1 predicted protein [Naegleria gruberi strain NEG-M]
MKQTEYPTSNSSTPSCGISNATTTSQLNQVADNMTSTSPSINKTLQDTPGFRMRKFNKNKRFKENYFEMRMMDTSASTCSSFESSFNGNIYNKVNHQTITNKRKTTTNNSSATSQSTSSKKRKKSASICSSSNNNMEVATTPFTSMSSGTITNSFPIVSFDSDSNMMIKSSTLPSFALSPNIINQEFPNLNDNFFSTNPSTTTQPVLVAEKPTIIENTSSLVELLMSNNNDNGYSGTLQQHEQASVAQQNSVISHATPNSVNNNSEQAQQHVIPSTSSGVLKPLVIGEGITSSCNNSIASPSASSSLSNSTVCNHLMINDQHQTTTLANCAPSMWGSILPLRPVCIDEICSEWEQLLSSNSNSTAVIVDSLKQQPQSLEAINM